MVDHSAFDTILQTYVDDAGRVDYAGLKASGDLEPYLALLAQTSPEDLSADEQVAFWLNVYNAYTLKLVTDHYPVTTIKKITPTGIPLSIPFIHSPFQIKVANVGGQTLSLDDVEHDILRKQFVEPRIHFALVCAVRSCPPLRREAYTGARLDAQLDDQARTFLHDATKNLVPETNDTIRLSRIFQWFRGDFAESKDGLQVFIAPYFDGTLRDRLAAQQFDVRFYDYDWRLNDQAQWPLDEAG